VSKLLPLLVSETGLSEYDVLKIVRNAPRRYKTYAIAKRSGGERTISQPARELKALQRILVEKVLSDLPVHPSATAYRKGMSIRANAAAHAGSGPILKFDFKDFFPSITARDWRIYCEKKSLFTDASDLWIATNLFFYKTDNSSSLRLAIGAPSSPTLSNILMNDFDTRISDMVYEDRVKYTRYADDMTFSAKRTGFLTIVEKALRRTIREIKSPSLTINEAKTVLATTKYKRFVTGLVLTNDGDVSIGQERKRKIRAALHNELYGRLEPSQRTELAGLLAFVYDVEPQFLARLEQKYGQGLIRRLRG
jgi:RNA-directed DNA polymerase